mmetsp:Transcript_41654/g.109983  ORF Transcript_41654/g.109983 Transcript_41654/m.109983 type:complete len:441 (-) Transcript_41654:136-1458(-)
MAAEHTCIHPLLFMVTASRPAKCLRLACRSELIICDLRGCEHRVCLPCQLSKLLANLVARAVRAPAAPHRSRRRRGQLAPEAGREEHGPQREDAASKRQRLLRGVDVEVEAVGVAVARPAPDVLQQHPRHGHPTGRQPLEHGGLRALGQHGLEEAEGLLGDREVAVHHADVQQPDQDTKAVRRGLQGRVILDEAGDDVEELPAILRGVRRRAGAGTVAALQEALGQPSQTVQADEVLLDGLVVLHGDAQRPERLRSCTRCSLGAQREVQEGRQAAHAVQVAGVVHLVHQVPQRLERVLQLLVRDGGVPEGADVPDQLGHDGGLVRKHCVEHVLPVDVLYRQVAVPVLYHELLDPLRIAVLDRPMQQLRLQVLALPQLSGPIGPAVRRLAVLLVVDHLHVHRRDGAAGELPAVQGQQQEGCDTVRPHRPRTNIVYGGRREK